MFPLPSFPYSQDRRRKSKVGNWTTSETKTERWGHFNTSTTFLTSETQTVWTIRVDSVSEATYTSSPMDLKSSKSNKSTFYSTHYYGGNLLIKNLGLYRHSGWTNIWSPKRVAILFLLEKRYKRLQNSNKQRGSRERKRRAREDGKEPERSKGTGVLFGRDRPRKRNEENQNNYGLRVEFGEMGTGGADPVDRERNGVRTVDFRKCRKTYGKQ